MIEITYIYRIISNYNVFNNRISLTTLEKGFLAIRLWIRSFLPIKKDPIV